MSSDDRRRTAMRVAAAVIGLAVVWLTVVLFTHANPVDLTVALLVVLAEVLAVAVLSGPILAVLVALAAVVLVNWYLVPPYGTFEIANADNVVALVVFAFVAAVAATLVEFGARARSRARESFRQAELIGEVVIPPEGEDAPAALERVRVGLHLDQVELQEAPRGAVLVRAGSPSTASVVLDLALPDGYQLVGRGPEIFAPDPDFLTTLGVAAVRAYESDRLAEESTRADELAAIDRARTALLASVGHDLRTPLAGLRVSIETLREFDSSLTDEDRQALLETIEVSSARLDELITNLLDMSRLQAGAVLVYPERTNVADVVDRTIVPFESPRLQVFVAPGLPAARVDPTLLERLLSNLVSNALRYAPVESPVEISAREEGPVIALDVADRGPGIPPEHMDEVFRPFHRVGAQADGGSGLGLAIVRGFAEAMGIEVVMVPQSPHGLRVSLRIPVWSDAELER